MAISFEWRTGDTSNIRDTCRCSRVWLRKGWRMSDRNVSANALRKELETIIELAEWGIANERLGGNVVKEEHWKGQRFAATQVVQWLDERVSNG